MLRERIITIDLDEGNYRILRYKQYDNNQILKIIIQENKEEIDLDFYTARLFFKLPSGSILEKDTTIENNRIIVSIDSGILSENGRIIVDLTLSNLEQIVTAFTMYFDVEETIDRNEAVQSKPEWDLITNAFNNLDAKVDKVEGKSLISNSEIERLANMEDNANNYVHPSTHKASMIVEDNTHRFITDLERVNWNNKVDSNQLHEHSNKDILDGITSDKVAKWDKAEENIQSDWNVTDTTSDAYIKNKPSIPSKVSELTNDNLYATETYVKNKIAEAQVGGGVDLSEYALKVDLNEKVDKVSGKGLSTNDYTNEEKNKLSNLSTVATSGSYNDLTNKPSIPTKTSQLTNDSSFASESYVTNAINNAQLGGGDGSSIDLSNYQTKTDNNLTTTNKTIVGAINELDIEGIKAEDYENDPVVVGNNLVARVSALETNESEVLSRVNSLESNKADVSTVSALETNKADKSSIPTSLPANGGNSNTVGGFSIWVGTQSEYDAISTKSSTTLYFIREV